MQSGKRARSPSPPVHPPVKGVPNAETAKQPPRRTYKVVKNITLSTGYDSQPASHARNRPSLPRPPRDELSALVSALNAAPARPRDPRSPHQSPSATGRPPQNPVPQPQPQPETAHLPQPHNLAQVLQSSARAAVAAIAQGRASNNWASLWDGSPGWAVRRRCAEAAALLHAAPPAPQPQPQPQPQLFWNPNPPPPPFSSSWSSFVAAGRSRVPASMSLAETGASTGRRAGEGAGTAAAAEGAEGRAEETAMAVEAGLGPAGRAAESAAAALAASAAVSNILNSVARQGPAEHSGGGGGSGYGGGKRGGGGGGGGGGRGARRSGEMAERSAPPSRPTHFLALRLSHAPSVTEAIERVQRGLLAHHPSLEDFLEPAVKAHLTLMVMALHDGPLPRFQPKPGPQTEPEPGPAPAPAAESKQQQEGAALGRQGRVSEPQQPTALDPRAGPERTPATNAAAWAGQGEGKGEGGGGAPAEVAAAAAPVAVGRRLGGPDPVPGRYRPYGGYGPLPQRLVDCLRLMTQLPGALVKAGVQQPLVLGLRGLGTFGSRVLFLEVDQDDSDASGTGDGASREPGEATSAAGAAAGAEPEPFAAVGPRSLRAASTDGATTAVVAAEAAAGGCEAAGCNSGRGPGGRALLLRLQSAVAAHFEELKYDEGDRPFAPHVTIAKVGYRPPWTRRSNGNSHRNGSSAGNRNKDGRNKSAETSANGKDISNKNCGRASNGSQGDNGGSNSDLFASDLATVPAVSVNLTTITTTSIPTAVTRSVTDEYGNHIIYFAPTAPQAAETTAAATGSAAAATTAAATAAGALVSGTVAVAAAASMAAAVLRPAGRSHEEQPDDRPLKNIPAAAYQSLLDIDAGSVLVDRVQLCAMSGRPPGGYYRVLAEVMLGSGGDDSGGRGEDGGDSSGNGEGENGSNGNCFEAHGGSGGGGVLADAAAAALQRYPGLHPSVRLSDEVLALLQAAAAAEDAAVAAAQEGAEMEVGTGEGEGAGEGQGHGRKKACVVM